MVKSFTLVGEAATQVLANDIAMVAAPCWTIRLEGDLGAGKTTFARAFIRALAKDDGCEVPSPTYTLVQRYDEAQPPVLHADLYRLGDPSEIVELGLDDADDPAIRLIEWPGNAGEGAFPGALTLSLTADGEEARTVHLTGPDEMVARIERTLAIRTLLESAGYSDATRQRLLGDASTRRYERLVDQPLIIMDAARQPDGPIVRDGKPYSQLVHLAESVHAFSAVGEALRERGFGAPAIHAADLDDGLLLIEDMGTETILDVQGAPDADRYRASVELLAALHKADWPADLPISGSASDGSTHHLHCYDSDVFMTEIALCPDWYVAHRGVELSAFDRDGFFAAWAKVLVPLDEESPTLTLRDYHSPNIIWQPGKVGAARLGLIDHQDAMRGPPAYDIASLVQDARVTIPITLQQDLLEAYIAASGVDDAWLRARFTVMAAQRNTKILGIFARLNARDGKPGYLKHLPRVEGYMRQLLQHSVLAQLKPYYDQLLPEDV
ncbi:MAG: tRNA (adenosine(37)-N6)-threonylcarbamoyltransferase complex ATPase subunit type 1 TsaE [Devosiaceae bacterium]